MSPKLNKVRDLAERQIKKNFLQRALATNLIHFMHDSLLKNAYLIENNPGQKIKPFFYKICKKIVATNIALVVLR